MVEPFPGFFAVIRLWVWRLSRHRVYATPVAAPACVCFPLFSLGLFLKRDEPVFHDASPQFFFMRTPDAGYPKTGYRGSDVSESIVSVVKHNVKAQTQNVTQMT